MDFDPIYNDGRYAIASEDPPGYYDVFNVLRDPQTGHTRYMQCGFVSTVQLAKIFEASAQLISSLMTRVR